MILSIDSSTTTISLALVHGTFERSVTLDVPRNRGGALFGKLEELIREAGELSRIVVGVGPGSYNGIRSSLAAGWGISAARKVPLVGLSSLLGLADGRYCAVGDARRQQFYFAVVENGAFLAEPALIEKNELAEKLEPWREWPKLVPAPLAELPEAEISRPCAVRLAKLGAEMAPSGSLPEPIYLKPAYINLPASRLGV